MGMKEKNALKEYIEREGLRLLRESQASSHLEDVIGDVDEGLITLYQKKFDKLKSEEQKALDEENYAELKRIKEGQVEALRKLIMLYQKKVELLTMLGKEIESGAQEVGSKGVSVFSDKNMDEFKNEDIVQGTKIKIAGSSKYFTAEKASDANTYKVLETNIGGIQVGDILKISDTKVGSPATVTVYRKIGDRFEELKPMKFNNVTDIVKNPSTDQSTDI